MIHQSHPTHYVTYDRTLQEIVYKLVPGLLEKEQKRRHEFVEERRRLGLPLDGGDSDVDEEEQRERKRKSKRARMNGKANGHSGDGSNVCLSRGNGGELNLKLWKCV